MVSSEIIEFINQTEEIFVYANTENIQSIYHYSVPNAKLSYPEPFIASASFMHSDLWFVHILIYQYWLWFVFIFIIVFFFITFLCTIRWCNMRIKPRRETRGVSRSKCGDLITACVPVSWATSIIVNESTDAIDYYDGFGTTELVVGIRAYQWGWEYYYPKDIDLNYNMKKNYSVFAGNSLKYSKSAKMGVSHNTLWKFYQNKNSDQIVTPAHLFMLPLDNQQTWNQLNFSDAGVNALQESNSFKKIKLISKTNNKNLFVENSSFSSSYKNFPFYCNNAGNSVESSLYAIKRQQNFLTNNALMHSNNTFFNKTAFNKISFFNFKTFATLEKTSNIFFFFDKSNFLTKTNFNFFFLSKLPTILRKNFYFKNYFESNSDSSLTVYNGLSPLNPESRKKLPSFYNQFDFKNIKNGDATLGNVLNFKTLSDLVSQTNLTHTRVTEQLDFKNKNNFLFSSSNEAVSVTNRSVRHFLNAPLKTSTSTANFFLKKKNIGNFDYFYFLKSKTTSCSFFAKQNATRISADLSYSPVISNNPSLNLLDFDSYSNTFVPGTPSILQGKEELIPNFVSSIYWNAYNANSDLNWRFANNLTFAKTNSKSYIPLFNLYYDYDFRNWQSLELFEDAYWETVYPIYLLDEYLVLAKDFYTPEYTNPASSRFLILNQKTPFKNGLLNKSLFKDTNCCNDNYMTSFYADDSLSPIELLTTHTLSLFPQINNFISQEDTYENFKFIMLFFFENGNNLSFFATNFLKSVDYGTVCDFFRSDADEFSWYADFSNFFLEKNLPKFLLNFSYNNNFSRNKTSRLSNTVNLRSTAKSAIVTNNAIQKVFKTRFDENRSHTKLEDFGSSFLTHPFVSAEKVPYEQLLKKNKESFFEINLYKYEFKKLFNVFLNAKSGLSVYFYDFPFLLALKSDPARYIWFDWYAKWGFYEVQPSSASRFSIAGVPYFSKNFEFNTANNENFNETENYLTRISKARKNYLPNWQHTPYFFVKNNFWYKNNIFFFNYQNPEASLPSTKFFLNESVYYWKGSVMFNLSSERSHPSNSNTATYSKTTWQPKTPSGAYHYYSTTLIDILTKREYLYREFLTKNYKIINLPNSLASANINPLLQEIKVNFLHFNAINLNYGQSKFLFLNALNQFSAHTVNPLLNHILNTFNFNGIIAPVFSHLLDTDAGKFKTYNLMEHNKNQYRPLKKGITNMIRLHATGAMALPIEIRLQILASSKDVIHSWAIPSAGIKIDCVPGYSSHRVMIFLVSGIFWGQCMEICGRYHHWMPIIVYFMKRDLFFLWCTHFIFLTNPNNSWSVNDRQYVDSTRTVSFDKSSWLNELSN